MKVTPRVSKQSLDRWKEELPLTDDNQHHRPYDRRRRQGVREEQRNIQNYEVSLFCSNACEYSSSPEGVWASREDEWSSAKAKKPSAVGSRQRVTLLPYLRERATESLPTPSSYMNTYRYAWICLYPYIYTGNLFPCVCGSTGRSGSRDRAVWCGRSSKSSEMSRVSLVSVESSLLLAHPAWWRRISKQEREAEGVLPSKSCCRVLFISC